MATMTRRDPSWWSKEYESGWDRVKEAFRRDWEQTKHDFGARAPDLKQDVGDTVAQAAGKKPVPPGSQPNYDEAEPAYRFGWGARQQYGQTHRDWNDDLEQRLRRDWEATYTEPTYQWDRYRAMVRRGWDYDTQR
jgi:hypothetical protein